MIKHKLKYAKVKTIAVNYECTMFTNLYTILCVTESMI